MGADRVPAVLKELARFPDGVGLEELARVIGSPEPTVHRALGALRRAGPAGQDARGRYGLGDEFLRPAFAHQEARPEHLRVRPAIDTRSLVLEDVTAVGILSASPCLDATVRAYAAGSVDPRPLVAATIGLDEVGPVLAGPGPKIHVDPRPGRPRTGP